MEEILKKTLNGLVQYLELYATKEVVQEFKHRINKQDWWPSLQNFLINESFNDGIKSTIFRFVRAFVPNYDNQFETKLENLMNLHDTFYERLFLNLFELKKAISRQ